MPINIFGFELGKKKMPETIKQIEPTEEPQVKSFIPPDIDDGASVIDYIGGYEFGVQLINYDVAYRSDAELIAKYRQMAEHAEVQTAIDDIVNQAIVLNENTDPISINLDKADLGAGVKKKIHEEFDYICRMLHFDTRGSDLFRRWYVDGRLYVQILMDEKQQKKGIVDLRVIDPTKIQKVRDIEREVGQNQIKFIKSIKDYYVYSADDFMGLGRDTINYRYASQGIIIPNDSVAFVHSGFIDQSSKKVLGYLHKAIKPLNQLRMLEDAVVIYRISRAPERRVFYIDVGSLPKNKAEQYIREIMQRYRNKMVYDTATGELRDQRNHMSMLEDFWMPRREGGKGTEIQTLPPGQNLGELQDIEYFQKKLYISLHIPPTRFKEETGFNVGKAAEISRDEVRFSKFVNRLQAKFSELFLQILRVQLISKNILTEDEWKDVAYDISFDFTSDSYFSELKVNEVMLTRLNALREIEPYLGRFFSKKWVKKNVLQMTEDDIDAMTAEIEKEAEEAPAQDQMGMGGGMSAPEGGMPPEGSPPPTEATEPPPEEPPAEESEGVTAKEILEPLGVTVEDEDEDSLGELPELDMYSEEVLKEAQDYFAENGSEEIPNKTKEVPQHLMESKTFRDALVRKAFTKISRP